MGIVLLVISVIGTCIMIPRLGKMATFELFKKIVWLVLSYTIGSMSLVRSLNQGYSKEDKINENDESNEFIATKAESKSFRFNLYMCKILEVFYNSIF